MLHANRIPQAGELAMAVSTGDFSLIDELILSGANPDQRDATGQTPLIYSVEAGQYKLVQRILKARADPNLIGRSGLTPLMTAVRMGRADLLMQLLNAGANPNVVTDIMADKSTSALTIAVDRGEFSITRRLIEAGADGLLLGEPETGNPLNLPVCSIPLDNRIWRGFARLKDNVNSPDWVSEEWDLHRAVRDGDWYTTVSLLNRQADPNKSDSQGITPLMIASWYGHQPLITLLLQRGASAGRIDRYGVDAISYAVISGTITILDQLLTSEMIVNPARFERNVLQRQALETSPYYWAVISGHPGILERLISFRLPLPDEGREGITLLMLAAWMSDSFAVRKLLPLANNVAAQDEAGRTALAWSLAAFDRDRQSGMENGYKNRGSRNYPLARMLTHSTGSPQYSNSLITPYIHPDVIESWSPGGYDSVNDEWFEMQPSPVPHLSGNGDLTLYRILRNEEQESIPEGE